MFEAAGLPPVACLVEADHASIEGKWLVYLRVHPFRAESEPRHILALHVITADIDDRAAVDALAGAVQAFTEGSVEKAFVDRGYTSERAATAARRHGIELEIVRLPEAKRGFVLLTRRWVVERSWD